MITALRKIEGRGELEGATSAVMEMCVDNPRSGFADLFATHPSIERRVAALVQFAGGHDPGPIALPAPDEPTSARNREQRAGRTTARSGEPQPGDKPFLPARAAGRRSAAHSAAERARPLGPHRT